MFYIIPLKQPEISRKPSFRWHTSKRAKPTTHRASETCLTESVAGTAPEGGTRVVFELLAAVFVRCFLFGGVPFKVVCLKFKYDIVLVIMYHCVGMTPQGEIMHSRG